MGMETSVNGKLLPNADRQQIIKLLYNEETPSPCTCRDDKHLGGGFGV